MGEFISKLLENYEKVEIINSSEIKTCSLFKLKEYQANYQMICESFSINFTEFEQIFGTFKNQNEFYLWDTDTNGLIDSFELFCGLILFADCSTEEKIKCLFELFDFNHTQSLAFFDLCYLIECCISSCFKMHKLGIPIPSKEIEIYLSGFFFKGVRSKLNEMMHFISNSPEVKKFLKLFKINPITQKESFEIEFKIQKDLYNDFKNSYLNNEGETFLLNGVEPNKIINNPRFDKFRNIIQNSTKRLVFHRSNEKPQIYSNSTIDYNLKLSWIYGIKIADIKKPCQYVNGGEFSISSGEMNLYSKDFARNSLIVYSVGKVVILLYVSFNKQKFYNAHENEVISIAVSQKNGNYIASGELAQRPAIHIWDSHSRETLSILKGHHMNGVHLLSFAYDENFILTCGKKEASPILIYDWQKRIIVFSFMMNFIPQDLKILHFDFEEDNNNSDEKRYINNFVLCSVKEISIVQIKPNKIFHYFLQLPRGHQNKEMITIFPLKGDIGVNAENTNQLLMMSNTLKCSNFGILVGYMTGEVNLFSVDGFISKFIIYSFIFYRTNCKI